MPRKYRTYRHTFTLKPISDRYVERFSLQGLKESAPARLAGFWLSDPVQFFARISGEIPYSPFFREWMNGCMHASGQSSFFRKSRLMKAKRLFDAESTTSFYILGNRSGAQQSPEANPESTSCRFDTLNEISRERQNAHVYIDGTGNPFYEKFKDFGVIWIASPAIVLILSSVIIGLWGNGNIVYSTWRTKSLHGSCNYLLAINAASDSVHGLAQFVQAVIFFSGTNFIPLLHCVYYQTIPLIGLNFGIVLIALIGIDRVISILLPSRHRTMNVTFYMIFMMGLCVIYNIVVLYFVYDYAIKNAKAPSACSIVDAMPGFPGNFWFYMCIVYNAITMVSYLIVWIAIHMKAGVSSSTKRVFKSLLAVTVVVFFGWTVNAISRLVLSNLDLEVEYFWIIGMYTGVFVNFAC
uniref:G_PROTEIN_RECEP_F1_2 domain-containing protein n=1 Tax=Panagrellus redivivus TaxID=6233 RepID=A0A7E4W5I2_PANRE